MELLNKILEKIKPSKEEEKEVLSKVDILLSRINKNLKDAKAILGGSGVKGTWLRNVHDADIFVLFNYNKYKDKSSGLSIILEKTLKKQFTKLIRLHGSRDYFQIKQKDFTFEIVPILDIKKAEQAKNITDVSPLHANWVNKKGKQLKDEIRLTKQFCKANDVYGAESYIQGFSGYICEILTIYYGGFLNLIKNAAKWKDKAIVDAENHWKAKNILMELNKSKTNSPLIVIDPVQKDRNAAAALSKEKFEKFKEAAKNFIKNPSEKFFEIKKINQELLKKKAGKNELIILEIKPQKGKEDVIGCKLVKALDFIKQKLAQNDFKVLGHGFEWEKESFFYFIIQKEKLSDFIQREGPPLENKAHVENFKNKHKETFIKNKRIYAKIKRHYIKAENLIKDLTKEDYLKDKLEGVKIKNE